LFAFLAIRILSIIWVPNSYFISKAAVHIDEKTLVARLRSKDKSALEYLYNHYSGALYGVISRVIKKEEVAEEVLQDVFLKIWDKIYNYDPERGKLFTWMLNIARNQAIDKTRSKEISKEGKTSGIENLVSKIDSQEFVEQAIEGIGVKEILKGLPEEQKFVVEQLYFQGYSQSELAEEFSIPLGTVKTRLRLAMNQLRSITKLI
jgi:RNA polymerase sigma-70 factor (ECF subfamily)